MTSSSSNHNNNNNPSPLSNNASSSSCSKLLHFIHSELFPPQQQHSPDHSDEDHHDDPTDPASSYASRRREKVYTFVTIPKELEKLMGYGFFQCADAFLYVFTFLPLRSFIAVYSYCWGWVRGVVWGGGGRRGGLKASDKCEILKVGILLICSFLFTYIDTNVLYHVVKSQSVIKLYIFFNMLEVGDRLFGCFSQDTLDALFITATEQTTHPAPSPTPPPPNSSPEKTRTRTKAIKKLSTTTHAIICTISILGHALVILFQSTTLSVAINANNRALLTVMMSNNFVELKGAVFKKFDKMNLFQVSCSDIRERFHLFILLLIVCLQTLREYSWEESRFWVLLPDCLMVLLAEIGVDWIKHAFITRFNDLPLQVYEHYTRSLAYDMAESVKNKSNRFSCDHSDVVGRRLGFVPLPLAIVLIRVVSPMWRVGGERVLGIVLLSICGYVGLASFRVLNMVVLVGKAVRIIDEHTAGESNVGDGVEKAAEPLISSSCSSPVKNSILKRTRTISGSDGDLYVALMKQEALSSKADKKLKFEDDLKDGGDGDGGMKEGLTKIHLLANSNVSLVSVGFNEEMMKVEEGLSCGGLDDSLGVRKHSLGSNLDEGVLLAVRRMRGDSSFGLDESAVVKVEEGIDDDDDGLLAEECGGDVVQEDCGEPGIVVKQEECECSSSSAALLDNSSTEEQSGGSSSSSSRKKKLINWFK